MTSMFVDLYPDVPVPKTLGQWIESAQHRLLRVGGASSAVLCGPAGLRLCGRSRPRGPARCQWCAVGAGPDKAGGHGLTSPASPKRLRHAPSAEIGEQRCDTTFETGPPGA